MEQARPVENLLAHRSMRIFIMFVPRRYGGSNMMHRSAPPGGRCPRQGLRGSLASHSVDAAHALQMSREKTLCHEGSHNDGQAQARAT